MPYTAIAFTVSPMLADAGAWFPTDNFAMVIYVVVAVVLLYAGYRAGRWIGMMSSSRSVAQKEQELFTAQKGFKNLYEQEIQTAKADNEQLRQQVAQLTTKVEDYRKKAAGYGGLFSSNSKRSDAMYALLLENEALEEALYTQNEKLRQERTDALKETLRSTGYRRTLITQLMSDDRIKGYVQEIVEEGRKLPAPAEAAHAADAPIPAADSPTPHVS